MIEITDAGTTRVLERNLAAAGEKAEVAGEQINHMKEALAGLGVALGIRELVHLSDEYTTLTNRIRAVTEGTAELETVMGRLHETAEETRTSFSSNVETFATLARGSKDMGVSIDEVLDVTKNLNELLQLTGRSSEDASGGIYQLTRAMRVGTVDAFQLRTIFRQLPGVLTLLADSLHVTEGELKKMAEEGNITGKQLFDALAGASASIEGRFAKLLPTIKQGLEKVADSALIMVGKFSEATGAGTGLSNALALLAKHVDILFVALIALAVTAIPSVVAGLKLLFAASLSNPILLAASAIAILVSAFVSFREELGLTNQVLIDFGVSILKNVVGAAATLGGSLNGIFFGIVNGVIAFAKQFPAGIADLVISGMNVLIRFVNAAVLEIQGLLNQLLEGIESTINAVNLELGRKATANLGRVAFGAVGELANAFEGEAGKLADVFGETFFDEFDNRLRGMQAKALEVFKAIDVGAAVVGAGLDKGTGTDTSKKGSTVRASVENSQILVQLREQVELEQQLAGVAGPAHEIGIQRQKIEKELIKELGKERADDIKLALSQVEVDLRRLDALKSLNATLEGVVSKQRDFKREQANLNELFRSGVITVDQYTKAMAKLNVENSEFVDALTVLKSKFLEIDTSIGATAGLIGDALVGAIDKAAGALADFALSGFKNVHDLREAFANLLQDLGKEILQIIIKMIILKTIQAALGGASGGVAGLAVENLDIGAAAAAGHATGGPVVGGRPVLVGERGPELFVPPGAGSIVPNDRVGGRGDVKVNIVNVRDPRETAAALASPEGEKAIMNVINKNRGVLSRTLS